MTTFLFAWELGGGLGHVLPFRPVAQALIAKGHRVVAALRKLTHVEGAFGDLPVETRAAPYKNWPSGDRGDPLLTFAHILHNTGWSRAVRGRGIRHCTFGTGFFCPPDQAPLPNLVPWLQADPDKLARDEAHVLNVANEVLSAHGQPPLARLSQLYADAGDRILTTFAELDHYGPRPNEQYVGWWPAGAGQRFEWPRGNGPKVYAYFKDFSAIAETAKYLQQEGWPTVIFAPGLLEKLRPFVSPSLVVTGTPLDLGQVAREADLILQNANHGTLTEFLLAGRPVVSVPITLEQAILARRVAEIGAGPSAANNRPDEIIGALQTLLRDGRSMQAAKRFAHKYAAFDSKQALATVVERLERLVK